MKSGPENKTSLESLLQSVLPYLSYDEITAVLETANDGNAAAQYMIGIALEGSPAEAHKWFVRSAEQGYEPARLRLGLESKARRDAVQEAFQKDGTTGK